LGIWSGLRVWKNLKATIEVEYSLQKRPITNEIIESFTEDGQLKYRRSREKFNLLLGVIFRAQNHDDYFMVELWKKNNYIVMRPHIRVSGNWDAPNLNPDENSYQLKTKVSKFTYVIEVRENVLTIMINGDHQNKLTWNIPSHYEINLIQHGSVNAGGLTKSVIRAIPFKDRVGMFGLRNYGNEIALVKKLIIEPVK